MEPDTDICSMLFITDPADCAEFLARQASQQPAPTESLNTLAPPVTTVVDPFGPQVPLHPDINNNGAEYTVYDLGYGATPVDPAIPRPIAPPAYRYAPAGAATGGGGASGVVYPESPPGDPLPPPPPETQMNSQPTPTGSMDGANVNGSGDGGGAAANPTGGGNVPSFSIEDTPGYGMYNPAYTPEEMQNELIDNYIIGNPDSWMAQASLTGPGLYALDPVKSPEVYARQVSRGLGQDSTYASIIEPLVGSAPGLLALMGQQNLDPVSLGQGIGDLVQQQMTPGQYTDTVGLLDNMFTSGDLSAWGLQPDASGFDQYDVIAGAAEAASGQLTEVGRNYLNTMLSEAYNDWVDLQLQGDTVDFVTYLRQIGAANWFE